MSGSRQEKKAIIKEIILELHGGLTAEEGKDKFEKQVGNITSKEIAEIEQELIEEGLSPEEVKKFCNVHSLIFQSALEKLEMKEEHPAHPVSLFKRENREIEKVVDGIKEAVQNMEGGEFQGVKEGLEKNLKELKGVDLHYTRKEQLLFPYLEKHGFTGPTKVMWGKDDEVRDLLKKAFAELSELSSKEQLKSVVENTVSPLVEEVEGMIYREENILFPTSLEMLSPKEWGEILSESDEVGYCFIEKPEDADALAGKLQEAEEKTTATEEMVYFPTGQLSLKELSALLNTLPVEITYVDKNDQAKYFSDNRERIFVRTKSIIGRNVQNCHPPQSVDLVEKILTSFKNGERDYADFWINMDGKLIYIIFLPVKDEAGNYLGTVEVTMDASKIKQIEGDKRLLDEK